VYGGIVGMQTGSNVRLSHDVPDFLAMSEQFAGKVHEV